MLIYKMSCVHEIMFKMIKKTSTSTSSVPVEPQKVTWKTPRFYNSVYVNN